ncbi:MAG: peptide deformylase [Rhodothermales bacterium]
MILPIHLLGSPILREDTVEVTPDMPEVQGLIDDMIETMQGARGIGLAAPQVGRSERIFVVDVSPMAEDFLEAGLAMPEQPMVFLNARITASGDEESEFEEGCLSIPDIHETVFRPDRIELEWMDGSFKLHRAWFDGILARVIQHEYDHVDGVLFIDHLRPLRRRLLKRRLLDIQEGRVSSDYPTYGHGIGLIAADPVS